jgi:hypothetical protein
MGKHAWKSVAHARDWRRNKWICAGCERVIFERATGRGKMPRKKLLQELGIPVDCDAEKARQVMDS